MQYIMRINKQNRPSVGLDLQRLSVALIAIGALSASAQPVTNTPPAPTSQPVELQPDAPGAGATIPAKAPFQWGIVGVRPHAFYRLSSGDGIQSRPGRRSSTTMSALSAGLLFDIGQRWTADYTPTWTFYSNPVFSDTVDHAFSLNGQALFTDGSIRFSQSYEVSNSPRIETGRQTHEETADTSLAFNYRLGRKTRLELTLGQNLRYVEDAQNSYSWSMQNMYHYQISNRISLGAGFDLGYVDVTPGIDMTYTRPQVRIGWRPTNKLSLNVNAGAEQRRFKRSGSADLNSPTYGAAVYYQPVEWTTLSLAGNRGVSASYFANQVNDSTSWNIGLNQRLLQRINLNMSASRTNSRYIPTTTSVITIVREDTSYSYNVRLSTRFVERGTIGIFYQRTRNSSDVSVYTFNSDQMGIEVGYRF